MGISMQKTGCGGVSATLNSKAWPEQAGPLQPSKKTRRNDVVHLVRFCAGISFAGCRLSHDKFRCSHLLELMGREVSGGQRREEAEHPKLFTV
jgi:hypothetical protein